MFIQVISFVILLLLFILNLTLVLTKKNVRIVVVRFWRRIFSKNRQDIFEIKKFAGQLARVLIKLSNDVVGGLIVLEKKVSLDKFVRLGYPVKALFSSEFIINIFYNKSSPIHDGGVIIRDGEIISVSSYLPMTNKSLPTIYGARHRAAAGITEYTDSIAFIVSETSGKISYACRGKINLLSQDYDVLLKQVFQLVQYGQIQENEIILNRH